MRRMRTGGIYGRLAIEELENGAAPAAGEGTDPAVAAEPIEAGIDSLEAELVEVNDDLVEIQADEQTTEEAVEVAEEMEAAVESLNVIAGNGGLDRNGAIILNQLQASWNRRLGAPANTRSMSVESFGGANSRIGQTKLAVEAIQDKAKELWSKIVELFRSALKAVGAMWNRIFDGATKLKARAEKVLKAAEGAKGEANAKSFENPKLAESLQIDGKVDAVKAAEIVAETAGLPEFIAQIGARHADLVAAMVESGDMEKLKAIVADGRKDAVANHTKVADPASVGMSNPGEGLELWKGEALPGNKAVIAIAPTEGADAAAVGKMNFKLGIFDASKKLGEKVELVVLSPADAVTVAKKIVAAADEMAKYKQAQKAAEAAANKVIALAAKKAKEAPAKEGEEKLNGADARNLTKGAMAMVINAAPPLAAYVLNTGASCLQYAEQSLKQYGKPAKAEETAPAAAAA